MGAYAGAEHQIKEMNSVYVVTNQVWTESPECLTARGINKRSPGAGTNPDAAPGATANWRRVILPQTTTEVRGILFK